MRRLLLSVLVLSGTIFTILHTNQASAFSVANFNDLQVGQRPGSLRLSCERSRIHVQLQSEDKTVFSGYAPNMPCNVSQRDTMQAFTLERWLGSLRKYGPRRLQAVLKRVVSRNRVQNAQNDERRLLDSKTCLLFSMAFSDKENLVFRCDNAKATATYASESRSTTPIKHPAVAKTPLQTACSCDAPFDSQLTMMKELPEEIRDQISATLRKERQQKRK